jgi:hypothetical protein
MNLLFIKYSKSTSSGASPALPIVMEVYADVDGYNSDTSSNEAYSRNSEKLVDSFGRCKELRNRNDSFVQKIKGICS